MGQQLKGIIICETDDSVAIVYELLKIQKYLTDPYQGNLSTN